MTLKQLPQDAQFWTDPQKHFVAIEGTMDLKIPGGTSSGTYQTLIHSISSYKKPSSEKKPASDTPKKKKRLNVNMHFSEHLNSYVVPFPTSDPIIVRRSAKLCNYEMNRTFEYGNFLQTNGFFATAWFVFCMAMFYILCLFSWTRKIMQRIYRNEGEGPSKKDLGTGILFSHGLENGSFRFTFKCNAKSARGSHEIVTQMSGLEPYTETARMASEATYCLMDQLAQQDTAVGILTPASAFGNALLDRLVRAGVQISTKKHMFEREEESAEKERKQRALNRYIYSD